MGVLTLLAALPLPAVTVQDTFDGGSNGWYLNPNWAWSANAGSNGSGALVNTRSDATDYAFITKSVALAPQGAYRFSAWVRGSGISGNDIGSGIIIQRFRNGSWIGGDDPLGYVTGTTDWQRIEGYGYGDPTATASELALYLRRGMTGTTTYDNVVLQEVGSGPSFNGSFATGTSGWSFQSSDWSWDSAGGRNGGGAVLLNRTSATQRGAALLSLGGSGLDFSIPYHFAVWVRSDNVQGSGKGGYIDAEYSSATAWLGWDDSSAGGGTGTQPWKRIDGIATPLPGTTNLQLDLFLPDGMTGKVWFDDLELQPLVTTRQELAGPPFNRAFDGDTAGWTFQSAEWTRDPTGGRNGSGALRLNRTSASARGAAVLWLGNRGLNFAASYRFAAWVRSEGVQGSGKGGYIDAEYNSATAWLGWDDSTEGGGTGTQGWKRIEGIAQPPPGTTGMQFDLFLPDGMTGTVWFDDLELEQLTGDPRLPQYPMISATTAPAVSVANADFASGSTGWNFSTSPNGFSVVAGQGPDGSAALRHVSSNANAWHYAYQYLTLQPGYTYTISADVRMTGIAGSGEGAKLGIDYSGGALGYLGGDSNAVATTNDGWTRLSLQTAPRPGATSCMLYLGLAAGQTGTVLFDRLTVTATGVQPVLVDLLAPTQGTISESDGRMILAVNAPPFAGYPSRLAKLLVRRNGMLVAERDHLLRGDRITTDLGQLPAGAYDLNLVLIDQHAQVVLGSSVLPFTVAPSNRTVPANAVLVDGLGRLTVGGAPFMPIGLFVDRLERSDIDTIAGAGAFNTVMPYRSPVLRFAGSTAGDVAAVGEVLDQCQAKGLKVLFGLSDFHPETRPWLKDSATILGQANAQREWGTLVTTDAQNAQLCQLAVESFRNHPALLGWYAQDEQRLSRLPVLIERRQLINRLDPFHGVFGAQLADLAYPPFANTWDIGAMDYYPVRTDLTLDAARTFVANVTRVTDSMRLSADASLCMGIVQAHNLGMYSSTTPGQRFPTTAEMRAMAVSEAIHGCRSFLFYSYYEMKQYSNGTLSQRLAAAKAAADTLVALRPYLMSGRSASGQPQVSTSAGLVEARAFAHDAGGLAVAIAGFAAPDAVITLPAGSPALRSTYGLTTALGNNRYRFTATTAQADLLVP